MCPGDSVPPVLGSGGPPRNVFSPSQCSSLPGLTGAGGVWLVGCHPWPRAVFVALRLRAARAHATLATTCSVSRWEGVEPQVAPEQLRTQEGEARCPLFALSLPQSRKRALTGLAMGVFGRAPPAEEGTVGIAGALATAQSCACSSVPRGCPEWLAPWTWTV